MRKGSAQFQEGLLQVCDRRSDTGRESPVLSREGTSVTLRELSLARALPVPVTHPELRVPSPAPAPGMAVLSPGLSRDVALSPQVSAPLLPSLAPPQIQRRQRGDAAAPGIHPRFCLFHKKQHHGTRVGCFSRRKRSVHSGSNSAEFSINAHPCREPWHCSGTCSSHCWSSSSSCPVSSASGFALNG